MQVESGLQSALHLHTVRLLTEGDDTRGCGDTKSALHLHTVRLLTEGDDTRGCGDTIGPPDDEQRAARKMLRSVV